MYFNTANIKNRYNFHTQSQISDIIMLVFLEGIPFAILNRKKNNNNIQTLINSRSHGSQFKIKKYKEIRIYFQLVMCDKTDLTAEAFRMWEASDVYIFSSENVHSHFDKLVINEIRIFANRYSKTSS